jgi:hypothetical protein
MGGNFEISSNLGTSRVNLDHLSRARDIFGVVHLQLMRTFPKGAKPKCQRRFRLLVRQCRFRDQTRLASFRLANHRYQFREVTRTLNINRAGALDSLFLITNLAQQRVKGRELHYSLF